MIYQEQCPVYLARIKILSLLLPSCLYTALFLCCCSSTEHRNSTGDTKDTESGSDTDSDTDTTSDTTEVDTSAPPMELTLDWLECIEDSQGVTKSSATSVGILSTNELLIGGEFHGQEYGESYLMKYSNDGTCLKLFHYNSVGDSDPAGVISVQALATDSEDNVNITGKFTGHVRLHNDIDAGVDLPPIGTNGSDIIVARVNPSSGVVWAKVSGGEDSPDMGDDIVVGSEGKVVVTGLFTVPGVFGLDEENETHFSLPDSQSVSINAFMASYEDNGNLEWARQDGGDEKDTARGVSNTLDGGYYFAGYCGGWNGEQPIFGIGQSNETVLEVSGFSDFYIARYSQDGTFTWVKSGGGNTTNLDIARDIGTTSMGSAVIIGEYSGEVVLNLGMSNETHFEPTEKINGFIAAYSANGDLEWARWFGSSEEDDAMALTINQDGIYLVGVVRGKAIFGKGEENQTVLSSFSGQMYIAKYATDGTFNWVSGIYKSMGDIAYDSNSTRPRDVLFYNDKIVVVGEYFGNVGMGSDADSNLNYCYSEYGGAFIAQYSLSNLEK